ncbi:hypothetical protein SK128_007226, partial [Halocaridina rubra]
MWGSHHHHQRSGSRIQGGGHCKFHHHHHVGTAGDEDDDDDEGGGWAVGVPRNSFPIRSVSSSTPPPGESYAIWMAEALANNTSYTPPSSTSVSTSSIAIATPVSSYPNHSSSFSSCFPEGGNHSLFTTTTSPSQAISPGATAMSLKINSVYIDTSPTRTSKPPPPTIRSNSLDQLNFQEKRQLIASTLSLSEILGGGPQKGKIKADVENNHENTSTTTTPTSNPTIVTKTASLSLSDIINATKGNK